MTETRPNHGRGGMPRLATPWKWDREDAKKPGAAWGCWNCGAEDSRVKETDKDDDGARIRRRQCFECGEEWETEEHRITKGIFHSRASRRRYRSYTKKRNTIMQCKACREMYRAGSFEKHATTSEEHRLVVERLAHKRVEAQRKYNSEWRSIERRLRLANTKIKQTR